MSGFDVLYKQTVTLFNRYTSEGSIYWASTVLQKVHFIPSQSVVISNYGERSADNAMLNVRYTLSGCSPVIEGKQYYEPKAFRSLSDPSKAITFQTGDDFDFIVEGDYGSDTPISDDDYTEGYYNYMNKTHDMVLAITNVAKYSLIPHFTITAR